MEEQKELLCCNAINEAFGKWGENWVEGQAL